jgi:hypothetical protein
MDAVQVNSRGSVLVYRNVTQNAGHFLSVRVRGTTKNRDALGARVVAQVGEATLVREINPYTGFASTSQLAAHFGLGDANEVEHLEVTWPSGKSVSLTNVAADQFLEVVEPE